jgi:hypothetical protein
VIPFGGHITEPAQFFLCKCQAQETFVDGVDYQKPAQTIAQQTALRFGNSPLGTGRFPHSEREQFSHSRYHEPLKMSVLRSRGNHNFLLTRRSAFGAGHSLASLLLNVILTIFFSEIFPPCFDAKCEIIPQNGDVAFPLSCRN